MRFFAIKVSAEAEFRHPNNASYQTLHAGYRTIGCPTLQDHACANSGMFDTTPFTLSFPGECGSTCASILADSAVEPAKPVHLPDGPKDGAKADAPFRTGSAIADF
jgi:hypothetical protein